MYRHVHAGQTLKIRSRMEQSGTMFSNENDGALPEVNCWDGGHGVGGGLAG